MNHKLSFQRKIASEDKILELTESNFFMCNGPDNLQYLTLEFHKITKPTSFELYASKYQLLQFLKDIIQ